MTIITGELSEWKKQLLAECEQAIRQLPEPGIIHLPESKGNEEPSLFGFYSELAALRNEHRSGNRKLSQVLGDFSNVLDNLGEKQASEPENQNRSADKPGNAKTAKALMDLLDRLDRIIAAGQTPLVEDNSFFPIFRRRPSPEKWIKQLESLEILRKHCAPLMELVGLEYRATEGERYDPRTMKAVSCPEGCDLNELIVTKEVVKGYWCNGENIRPAEVETDKADAT